MESWVNAVNSDNFDLFKTAVNEGNINNYVTVASGDMASFSKVMLVDALPLSLRGEGGFGSTGR